MNPMSLSSHQLVRLLVLLLLTAFVSETVYASSMMASVQEVSSHTEAQVEHCHETLNAQQVHKNQHTQSGCKDCSHCFACFSMMALGQSNAPELQKPLIETDVFVEIYHSPSTTQPQKPPIA